MRDLLKHSVAASCGIMLVRSICTLDMVKIINGPIRLAIRSVCYSKSICEFALTPRIFLVYSCKWLSDWQLALSTLSVLRDWI